MKTNPRVFKKKETAGIFIKLDAYLKCLLELSLINDMKRWKKYANEQKEKGNEMMCRYYLEMAADNGCIYDQLNEKEIPEM